MACIGRRKGKKMNTVRRMKNGQYDIHLDFYMMLFIKNLLELWIRRNKQTPFSNDKQVEFLQQIEAALNLPEDVGKIFQEEIETNRFKNNFFASIGEEE